MEKSSDPGTDVIRNDNNEPDTKDKNVPVVGPGGGEALVS